MSAEMALLQQIKNKSVETVEINSLIDATKVEDARKLFTRGAKEFLCPNTLIEATVEDYPDIHFDHRHIDTGLSESFGLSFFPEQMVIDDGKVYASVSGQVRVFDTSTGTYVDREVSNNSGPSSVVRQKSLVVGSKILMINGNASVNLPKIASSTDGGVTFTAQITGAYTIAKLFSLAVNDAGTSWIAHATALTTTAGDVWTSTDGLAWTSRTPSAAIANGYVCECFWLPFLSEWIYLSMLYNSSLYWTLSTNGYTVGSSGTYGATSVLIETLKIEADRLTIVTKTALSATGYRKYILSNTAVWTYEDVEASTVVLASTTEGQHSSYTTTDVLFENKVSFDGGVTTTAITDTTNINYTAGYAIWKMLPNNYMVVAGVSGVVGCSIKKYVTDFRYVKWQMPTNAYGKAMRIK